MRGTRTRALVVLALVLALVGAGRSGDDDPDGDASSSGSASGPDDGTTTTTVATTTTTTTPNVYAATSAAGLNPKLAGLAPRVYVPNSLSGTVTVIDPATFQVIDTFPTGPTPQHVVPSWDLSTLWVNNNGGSLTQ